MAVSLFGGRLVIKVYEVDGEGKPIRAYTLKDCFATSIRTERNLIETTTFGDDSPQYMPGGVQRITFEAQAGSIVVDSDLPKGRVDEGDPVNPKEVEEVFRKFRVR